MARFLQVTAAAFLLLNVTGGWAQTLAGTATPIPSRTVPAGPRPTATLTPLPSASPAGTQPQTTNTVTPSPAPR